MVARGRWVGLVGSAVLFGHMAATFVLNADAFRGVDLRPPPECDDEHGERHHHSGAKHRQPGQPQTPHHARGPLAFVSRGAPPRSTGLGG